MSPVSRGRRRKKGKPGGGSPTGSGAAPWGDPESLTGPRTQPGWFDPSIARVVDGAHARLTTRGPRELEEATAELLGAELHRAIREEREGLWLDWWFERLVERAVARLRLEASHADGWQAPWWLLHGLTSIGPPRLAAAAQTALGRGKKLLAKDAYQSQPEWLRLLPRIGATGEVWQMRDVYGARFAVIAGVSYPGDTDRSVFLFDIDACGLVALVRAGVFDGVEEAAANWRAAVGEAADHATPTPVETAEQLACLVQGQTGQDIIEGTETRTVADNWFRARRRTHDLAQALRRRGMELPEARNLFDHVDPEPMSQAFTAWYRTAHGTQPDPEGVEALAAEWLEGALPETRQAASPHRARYLRTLIGDWIPDHPVTVAAKALLPEWVRWNGDQAGLPEHFISRAVAAAADDSGPAAEWESSGAE